MISRFRRARRGLDEETKLMERAARRKLSRYTSSGIIVTVVGVLIIASSLSLHEGAYSLEGLIIGVGVIVVIVGIVRILIGLINPSTPADLRAVVRPEDIDADNTDNSNDNKPIPLDKLTYQNPTIESDGI